MAKEKRDLKINKGTKKENTTKKGMGLSTKIFIALLVGALLGVGIHYGLPSGYFRDIILVEGILYVVGQGFIRLMQMETSVPIVDRFTLSHKL